MKNENEVDESFKYGKYPWLSGIFYAWIYSGWGFVIVFSFSCPPLGGILAILWIISLLIVFVVIDDGDFP